MEAAKSDGWFVFLYRGLIDSRGLQFGNKLIIVGVVEGNQRITIKGTQRTVPYLVARCVYVWKTGRYAVGDYPNLPDGYFPLEQQRYCLPSTE